MVIEGFLAWGIWAWIVFGAGWLVLCALVTAIIIGIRNLRELIKELRDAKAEEDARPERSAPRANLIQWAGHEDTRDRIMNYADRKKVSVNQALIESVKRGIDQLDTQGGSK
jgi:hypothetical protein